MPRSRTPSAPPLVLRGFRRAGVAEGDPRTLVLADGRVAAVPAPAGAPASGVDLGGRVLLPGLVNAHDHLDLSTCPPVGEPPYANLYQWSDALAGAFDGLRPALAVPLVERLFLGGLRNLLAGASAAVHHGPFHRSLARPGFPVRVQARYQFAHAPGITPHLRRTYRSSDRRIPWFVHAGEGTDAASRNEIDALAAANVLRQNTVVVQGLAFGRDAAVRLAAARACVVWQPEAARRLYHAAADLAAWRAAGVRVGLGSDSAATGARDVLSNLAAARREAPLSDGELLELATGGSGEVARLPVGGWESGAPADYVAVDALDRFLAGDRRSVALVVVAGRALYGAPALMDGAGVPAAPVVVDGVERRLHTVLAAPARSLFAAFPALRRAAWAAAVEWPA